MMTITNREEGYVEIQASGKLERSDYERVVPQLESEAERGKLRLLVELVDFEGWTPKALVEDLRYDLKHHGDFEKTAIVGDKTLEKWATTLAKPFFSGEMRYFEDLDAARRWIRG
jgi:hypothetical protein